MTALLIIGAVWYLIAIGTAIGLARASAGTLHSNRDRGRYHG